jgi:hypothetical protein
MRAVAIAGSGPSRILLWLWLCALPAAPTPAQQAPEAGFPGMQLRARVEAHVQRQKEALKADLTHYSLIFPIEPEDFDAYMKQVLLRFDGRDAVLGSADGVESHGGGLLAFILEHWRPASRAALLTDRFWFERNRSRLELVQIYQAHRRQIFLPVPGREPDAIDGKLPEAPQLARMQFRYRAPTGGVASAEVDSYPFLRLLVEREEDLSRPWVNRLGQTLSADLLLGQAWDHYVAKSSPDDELADHSNLHLVEVLLGFSRRRASSATPDTDRRDANEIKRRFLAVELRRTDFPADTWSLRVGHHLESLGRLLDDSRVAWGTDEKRQVVDWLRSLDEAVDRDLDGAEVAHFLKGLRSIEQHRAKLEDFATDPRGSAHDFAE